CQSPLKRLKTRDMENSSASSSSSRFTSSTSTAYQQQSPRINLSFLSRNDDSTRPLPNQKASIYNFNNNININKKISTPPPTTQVPTTTRFIDLREKPDEEEIESSRIIDLSTGEALEVIPSVEKQRQRQQKRKRRIDQDGGRSTSINNNVNKPLNKKMRISLQPTTNFIEEIEEESDKSDIEQNDNNITKEKSASIFQQGGKLKFTVPYKKAFADYMRSQFEYMKKGDDNAGKIYEIIEDDNQAAADIDLMKPSMTMELDGDMEVLDDKVVNGSVMEEEIPVDEMEID
ncbi:9213_t:CDS:2, partial [Ambispora leptoticha]